MEKESTAMPQSISFDHCRRRDLRPAAIALVFTAFLVGALAWQIEAEQRQDRARAIARSHELLLRCREITEQYLLERRREQERRQEAAAQLVAALAGDFQSNIQAVLAAAARHSGDGPLLALARLWGLVSPAAVDSEWPEIALLTASADLAQRMPPNCSLTVCQEGGRMLLRLSGKTASATEKQLETTRRLEFDINGKLRCWFLTVAMNAPVLPEVTAGEIAEELGRRLGLANSEHEAWRGIIIDAEGKILEVFPAIAPGPRVMPLPSRSGEWLAIDGPVQPRLTRLDRLSLASAPWSIGMQIVIDAPALFAAMEKRIYEDWRWAGLLGLSAFAFCLCSLVALLRPLRAQPVLTPVAAAPRLVPKAGSGRSRAAGITFAEVIAGDEQTSIMLHDSLPPRQGAPGDSLRHLQQMHRGAPALGSTRILDHARSALLRELAKKVRPVRRSETSVRRVDAAPESACTKNTGR